MIFGVCPMVEKQKIEIDKHCFGDCGKILLGGMIDDLLALLPCKEKKCPYEEKSLKYGICKGQIIYIRKLKEVEK